MQEKLEWNFRHFQGTICTYLKQIWQDETNPFNLPGMPYEVAGLLWGSLFVVDLGGRCKTGLRRGSVVASDPVLP